jgi:acetylornithine deacetylase/succinyl-diaminopimelate desuccinylase-like protein
MKVVTPRVAHWVSELVRIPSVNPDQAGPRSGPPGERAIALALAEWFEALGGRGELHEVMDGRPNVYGCFPGNTGRLAVLDVHTDTVTVEHMTDDPFDGRIEDERVWGRGAVDSKASLGVILSLLERWQAEAKRPEPTLLVVGSISEEGGGMLGAVAFREWLEAHGLVPDQVVVSEPTSCCPIYGHKGGVGFRVTVHGHAVHSSVSHLGRNAIVAASRAVLALEDEHVRLQSLTPTTDVGNGAINVGLIQGGTGSNVVPATCSFTVGRRIVPGEEPEEVAAQVRAIIEGALHPCPATIEQLNPAVQAFYQSPDSELVHLLTQACDSQAMTAPYGTNALRYVGGVREMVVFGPGSIEQAHAAREWVTIDELERCARAFEAWLRPSASGE